MGWAPGAKLAASVGGFNNRNPNAKVLTRDEIGAWKTLLPNEMVGSAPTPHDSVDEANVFSHLQPKILKSLGIPATKLFTKPSNTPKKLTGPIVDLAGAPTAPLTSPAKLYQSMAEEEKLPKIRVDSIKDEGLMPVSFKVRVVLLDGDDLVTKEILDINLSSRYGTPEDFKSLTDKTHSLGLRVLRDVIHSQSNNNITDGLNGFDVGHPSLIRWCSWMPALSSLNIMSVVIAMFLRESRQSSKTTI
ncbi:hypothetical protein Nepgr_016867 [Nepenthes gracilis]|uniref:Uncharacterized protein n=1 Tax=Nepenthes gracilis TaxID=150966 RepID=A0AAD3SR15_NEPGR|nr:hypothetical protein Nepgr_016867 [Nepenthes gracilis]